MSESFRALTADIEWRANTAKTEQEVHQLRQSFHAATASMSDDSLKLAAAQDRLDRALAKHGPTSRAAASAELELRRAMGQSTRASEQHSVALNREQREISQLARGAITGSGALRGLGRAAVFASSGFLGGAGIVYAIRSTISAAEDSERVLTQTRNAVERSGLSWREYGHQVEAAALQLSQASGFDDERLLATFSLMVRGTKDVNEALHLNALAANVARGANIELEQAAKIVLRASAGQARGLAVLGIETKKGATATQLLAQITQKYANSAATYGATATGAQERFSVAIENTQEAIATRYLPALADYLNGGADWLNQTKNQERIQRDVNQAVHAGSRIAHGFADAVELIAPPVRDVVHALGGLEHAAEAALIVALLTKAKSAAGGFSLIQSASARTRAAVIADATAEAGALRGVAGAAETAAGRINRARARAGFRTAAGAAGAAALVVPSATGHGGSEAAANIGTAALLAAAGQPELAAAYLGIAYHDKITGPSTTLTPEQLDVLYPGGRARRLAADTVSPARGDGIGAFDALRKLAGSAAGGVRSAADALPSVPDRPAAAGPTILTAAQIRARSLSAADLTAGTADDVAAAQAQAVYDRRALAFLEQRRAAGKITAAKYLEQYEALSSDLAAMQGRLSAIDEAAAEKAREAAAKAKTAADRRAAAAKRAAEERARAARRAAEDLAALQLAYRRTDANAGKLVTSLGQVDIKGAVVGTLTAKFTQLDPDLLIAEARARTEEQKLAVYGREARALAANVRKLQDIGAGKKAILKVERDRATVQKHIDAIRADQANAARNEASAFNDYRLAFLGQFAGNVFQRGPAGLLTGGAGVGGPHPGHETNRLAREQNDLLKQIAKRPAHQAMQSLTLAMEGLFGG